MRTNTARELGAVVRNSRKNLSRTQLDVANAAGVERSWLARLEGGRENPTFAKLLAVAAELGLQIELTDQRGVSTKTTRIPTPIDLDSMLTQFDERR
jgi:transcriptional regulator with XRE-family HTH domain